MPGRWTALVNEHTHSDPQTSVCFSKEDTKVPLLLLVKHITCYSPSTCSKTKLTERTLSSLLVHGSKRHYDKQKRKQKLTFLLDVSFWKKAQDYAMYITTLINNNKKRKFILRILYSRMLDNISFLLFRSHGHVYMYYGELMLK